MKELRLLLRENPGVTDYIINTHEKKSYEMFFVKGKLETVRCTNTCDTSVTVYAAHDAFLGNADFFVYPSTTEEQVKGLIEEAVQKALLINNKPYSLPADEAGEYTVESNFSEFSPDALAAVVANTVFDANRIENGSLNAVEVFVNRHHETITNSRGIHKSQTRYDAMVEAIPTYNGAEQSVELYEQYNFSNLDEETLYQEIADMMTAVKARYEAVKPQEALCCKVILNKQEIATLVSRIAGGLEYSSVYNHSTIFKKGDDIQKATTGDPISLTMAGALKGSVHSRRFDSDGMTLGQMEIVKDGVAVNYYGSNRYGQYLGETPTGSLPCAHLALGSMSEAEMKQGAYLEVVSMSGLQVNFLQDYIGGEIRLAYYHDGSKLIPVTGISVSGSLSKVLQTIRFSSTEAMHGAYVGPDKALLDDMKIF